MKDFLSKENQFNKKLNELQEQLNQIKQESNNKESSLTIQLNQLKKKNSESIENFVNLQKKIEENAKILNIPVQFFESDIFQVVTNIEKSPCYLCARMRRGFLYAKAKELGCNKIALGHHIDDVVETILMGMFYGSQIQTMMPKLHSTNFKGMELIRPMYLIEEKDIIHWCQHNNLTFIQCACRFTEEMEELGDVHHTSKREEMKNLIKYLETMNPNVKKNIFKRFYKGENSKIDSIGIGLNLAKKIIEIDNGMIEVNSVFNEGTTFTIKYFK